MSKTSNKATLKQALLSGRVLFAGHISIRGGYYHGMWEAKVDGDLKEGAWLKLVREPKNPHDSNAIAVYNASGTQMIGYVAKEEAKFLAPFADLGVKMAARVFSHSGQHEPIRMTARLYIKK